MEHHPDGSIRWDFSAIEGTDTYHISLSRGYEEVPIGRPCTLEDAATLIAREHVEEERSSRFFGLDPIDEGRLLGLVEEYVSKMEQPGPNDDAPLSVPMDSTKGMLFDDHA